MIDFLGNTAIALGFTALGVCALAQPAKANEIENLAIYAVDRVQCKLTVSQAEIDRNIVDGSMRYNATAKQVIDKAAEIAKAMMGIMQENGQTEEYCRGRKGV
jgi:intracellular sulfur oxidation DsrE/DsrF family protein